MSGGLNLVKRALHFNAPAVIAHSHPSGVAEPSRAAMPTASLGSRETHLLQYYLQPEALSVASSHRENCL